MNKFLELLTIKLSDIYVNGKWVVVIYISFVIMITLFTSRYVLDMDYMYTQVVFNTAFAILMLTALVSVLTRLLNYIMKHDLVITTNDYVRLPHSGECMKVL